MSLTIAYSLDTLPEGVKRKLESANAYYSTQYEQYILAEGSAPVYAYNDELIQVLTIHKIKKIFCTATLLCEPHWLKEEQSISAQQLFLDQLLLVLKKELGVDWVNVTPACSLFVAYPSVSERIRFGNYVIDLSADEDALLANMDSKHRNMVRRGERGGVEVKFGGLELLPDYILLDKQTWERSGQFVNNTHYYEKYVKELTPQIVVAVAYKDSAPQCGLIGLYNKKMFYYMFGASAHKPEPGATHFLQWQTILRMKQYGVGAYNFVGCRLNIEKGSKYYKIQHFKKGFGGRLQEVFLFRATLNVPKKWLFALLFKMRTGKKMQDVIDQEKHKWKEIN